MALFALVLGGGVARTVVAMVQGLTFTRPSLGAPAPALAFHPDAQLQQHVEGTAKLPEGTVAVAIRDLRGGATAEVNAHQTFQAASLFKVPILVEVLRAERLGRLPMDRELLIGQEHWTEGSGVLQARVGDRLPVRELLRLMIEESDNIAALVLMDAVGVDSVNDSMEALGLTSTRLVDRRKETGDHTTSAADMALLFETLATGKLIDAETSEKALRLLEARQANAWLSDELPWWVKIPHKWGALPDHRHDAGVVFAPEATFVVAVLTEDGSADNAHRAIAKVTRSAYDYLSGTQLGPLFTR